MGHMDKRDIGHRVSDLGALRYVPEVSLRLHFGRKMDACNFHVERVRAKKNEKIDFPFSAVGEFQKLREGPRTRQGTSPKHFGAPGCASGHPAEK